MTKVLLMFKVHQPIRIAEYSFFDLGKHKNYFNDQLNRHIIDRVAENCYLPFNKVLKKLVAKSHGDFKFSIALSGTTFDQLEKYRPDVLEDFVKLVDIGKAEVVCEPYYYSLASFYSKAEFKEQVDLHRNKVEKVFSQQPVTFLNTEFSYNNELATQVENMGFWAVLAEGADWVLNGRNPNELYSAYNQNVNLFLRNYHLADDLKFNFSDFGWRNYSLSPSKYYSWIASSHGDNVNLFYDYENFGEHHKKDTGIFDFMERVLTALLNSKYVQFNTFQDAVSATRQMERLNVPYAVSRADQEKDLTAWRGNAMQYEAIKQVYQLEEKVKQSDDPEMLRQWRLLQTADHFYYMSTKGMKDGKIHKHFSPFYSPHDSYRYFMNILSDFELKLDKMLNYKKPLLVNIS